MRRPATLLLTASLLVSPLCASNQLEEAILFEHRQAIAALEAAKQALQNHAQAAVKRRRAWLAFYESLRGSFTLQVAALLTDQRLVLRRLKLTEGYVGTLARKSDESVATPSGGYSPVRIADTLRKLTHDLAQLERAIATSVHGFLIPGLPGTVTKDALEQVIGDERAAIDKLNKSVTEGSYKIYYPIVRRPGGSRDRQSIDKEIASETEAMEKKQRLIASGDYAVNVPGFVERMTRKTMKATIDTQYERVAEISGQVESGTYPIRTFISANPLTRQQIEASIESIRSTVAKTRAAFDAGKWQTAFPGFGLITVAGLELRKKQNEDRIQKVSELQSKGDFAIHVPGIGSASRNGINRLLKGLVGKTDAASVKRRADYAAALPKIDAGAKMAVEHATMEIERIDNMLRLAPELFKTWLQRKEVEIAERQRLIDDDLRTHAAIAIQETERYIKTLEMRRDIYIP